MSFFTLELITPERVVLKTEADQVTLRTPEGQITILPHHIPLVTVVQAGELMVKAGTVETPLAVSGGVLEIQGHHIRVLTDTAERVEDIDVAKAEQAKRRAEAAIANRHLLGEEEYALVAAKLERDLVRLRVSRKYAHRAHRPTPTLES